MSPYGSINCLCYRIIAFIQRPCTNYEYIVICTVFRTIYAYWYSYNTFMLKVIVLLSSSTCFFNRWPYDTVYASIILYIFTMKLVTYVTYYLEVCMFKRIFKRISHMTIDIIMITYKYISILKHLCVYLCHCSIT